MVFAYGAGTGPFGTMPMGTAMAPPVAITKAESVAENRIRLYFAIAPLARNIGEYNDALDPEHYTLTVQEETVDRVGQPTRPTRVVAAVPVDELTIDLILDRPMSSYGSLYTLSVEGLVDTTGAPLADQDFIILGVFKGIPAVGRDVVYNNRDLAYAVPVEGAEPSTGGLQLDHRNDIGVDAGIIAWKKRVTRRLTTRKGEFTQHPNYGVEALNRVKQLAVPGIREALAVDAEEQIRLEPETRSASVILQPGSVPGVFYYRIKADTVFGMTAFDVPVASTSD